MPTRLLLVGVIAGLWAAPSYAQAVRTPRPYSAQLRTDPAVGNVQGIQRYGRPLKTDPDEGEGFSYHVYPVAENPAQTLLAAGQQSGRQQDVSRMEAVTDAERKWAAANATADEALRAIYQDLEAGEKKTLADLLDGKGVDDEKLLRLFQTKAKFQDTSELGKFLAKSKSKQAARFPKIIKDFDEAKYQYFHPTAPQGSRGMVGTGSGAPTGVTGAAVAPVYLPPVSPYPPPFDATAGLRQPTTPSPGVFPAGAAVPLTGAVDGLLTAGIVYTRPPPPKDGVVTEIYHQPLIQVKVRVIEVARTDALEATSVLDIIGRPFDKPTLIAGNNVNRNHRDLFTGTRFTLPQNLIDFTGNGSDLSKIVNSGILVNLTTGNLNWIARLLASEFHSDIVTAPEVVTLNGQNVEFVSGEKLPFPLGQNVIQGNADNIQQFFYKHVGTFVSITPRIVNWGKLAEGSGKAPLVDTDIPDWRSFLARLRELHKAHMIVLKDTSTTPPKDFSFDGALANFIDRGGALPLEIRGQILDALKGYAKADLVCLGLPIVDHCGCGGGCAWHAEDCTIDLETVVRLSEGGEVTFPATATSGITSSKETNVRGIANIVQVKSGHGAVIGGLIGERDIREVEKVPILGDIPYLGFFFRSTSTQRQKTELLIFIEARVLDPDPEVARAQSYENFALSTAYVAGEFLDNPLEAGMYRAGFGPYLPPYSHDEQLFWERLGRKVRKAATEFDDIFK